MPFGHFPGIGQHGLHSRAHLSLLFPEGFQEFLAGQTLCDQVRQNGFCQFSALVGCNRTDDDGILRDALEGKDREEASRISHKLIPLFTMLGANSLVQHLRILEKNDEELTDSGWYHLLGEVIEQALAIVKDAESAIG